LAQRNQYWDNKAVKQDAAGRSSDPEPLTAEDKLIAINIMAIPPLCLARSLVPVGSWGRGEMRQPCIFAALQHLLSADLPALHVRQASHALKKDAGSRDLLARPVPRGRGAAVSIPLGQKQPPKYMCAIWHSMVLSRKYVPSRMQGIDIAMLCLQNKLIM
jgi:hypothetical protein